MHEKSTPYATNNHILFKDDVMKFDDIFDFKVQIEMIKEIDKKTRIYWNL